MKNFFATPLKDEDFKKRNFCYEAWIGNCFYAWDCGKAIGRYLEGLKEGKILGVKCSKCERIMVPPRIFCEWCFVLVEDFVELKDTGRINTFSISYITWDMKRLEKPQIPAVIEIDGASPGYGILHLVSEVDPKEVKVGMRVKAVWKDEKEREGKITDIKYFKPY
ncbi:MAG: Zn-ribbon domain-containing OB-fold protein [candidate division WOR-3 bacterium]|uniref:Zn-ribbon domain-containing OB-fold protein n=1 Tax=candidate division WOR-3 bacterium TaxID=2052148 RepID=A0A7C4VZW7_UNCW3